MFKEFCDLLREAYNYGGLIYAALVINIAELLLIGYLLYKVIQKRIIPPKCSDAIIPCIDALKTNIQEFLDKVEEIAESVESTVHMLGSMDAKFPQMILDLETRVSRLSDKISDALTSSFDKALDSLALKDQEILTKIRDIMKEVDDVSHTLGTLTVTLSDVRDKGRYSSDHIDIISQRVDRCKDLLTEIQTRIDILLPRKSVGTF